MFAFHPAVVRDETLIELPRPVISLRVIDSWDFKKLKVPLREGEQVQGHSRDGAVINIEGQFGTHSGALRLSESEMLASLDTLRTALDVNPAATPYTLVLYEEASSDQYRYFRDCSTVRFEFDLSNPAIYSYAISIHAADPRLLSGILDIS